MAPTSTQAASQPDVVLQEQLEAGKKLATPAKGEEIVISGLAGKYPDSRDVSQFRDNLFNKVDMVNDENKRWNVEMPGLPSRSGKTPGAEKFDATFFGMHHQQAHASDPSLRAVLEMAVECLMDAGVNPRDVRGTNTGIFLGVCVNESEDIWFYKEETDGGYGVTTTPRPRLASRLSYYLGTKGPAYVVDSACSSSLYALDMAYKSIRDGHCDAAIVAGSNFCLYPCVSQCFAMLGVLSPNGMCKPFDEDANGYARSEAVTVVYLQKAKEAKRVYAHLVHSKSNCDGYKPEGITFPAGKLQRRLMTEVYNESDVDPLHMSYVEAHGTGTKVGDPEELDAIDSVFCTGRDTPLPIGSVKSNIGHSEPTSGLCSLTKVIIAMETGFIPPNINFDNPKKTVDGLTTGRFKVITEKTPWTPGYVAVNSFGFGGANCHVLLKPNPKLKVKGDSQTDRLPFLVMASGRTEEAVKVILEELAQQTPVDPEFVALLHNVFAEQIPGHKHRGYVILKDNGEHLKNVQPFDEAKRPVWFLFPGIGCHWPEMARELMAVPAFAASMERCHQVLLPLGVNLKNIVTLPDDAIFQDIVNISVGIVAVQVGLTDVLTALGVTPDGIVGYSIGEISSAYADGCFDTRQAMLAAYWWGVACKQHVATKGAMATVVGLEAEEVRKIVPPEIDIACQDSSDRCTISGPSEEIQKAVDLLKDREAFVEKVECGGVPVHSRYVKDAGKQLMMYMKKLIPRPKQRSDRWISSSLSEEKWSNSQGQYSSAQYHANNLLSPVLFRRAIEKIPNKAVVVEISPRGTLRQTFETILRRKDQTHITLSSNEGTDNTQFLLTAVGRLFQAGLHPLIHKLYPEVTFPVSRGTPMISPLIKWDHSSDWFLLSYGYSMTDKYSGESRVTIDMTAAKNKYLTGHTIDGRNLFPATGYLCLVWDAVVQMSSYVMDQVSPVFENVRFLRATNLPKDGEVTFTVMVQKASGNFEVSEGSSAIVTGNIRISEHPDNEMSDLSSLVEPNREGDLLELQTKDIYKELRLRGYNYSGLFRGLMSADSKGRFGKTKWTGNWVAFMDTLLQIQILQEDTRGLFVPTTIEKMVINVDRHYKAIGEMSVDGNDDADAVLPVYVCKEARVIVSGGVEIRCPLVSAIARRKRVADPVLEKYQFVPYFSPMTSSPSLQTVLRMCVHLLLENTPALKVSVAELVDTPVLKDDSVLGPAVADILGDLPLVQPVITIFCQPGTITEDLGTNITIEEGPLKGEELLLVIASDILSDEEKLKAAMECVVDGGCLLARENVSLTDFDFSDLGFSAAFHQIVGEERIIFLRKVKPHESTAVLQITEKNFDWLPELQAALANKDVDRVLLIAQNEPENGILGLVNCLRKEPGGKKVRCVFILDPQAPPFDPENPLYKTQLSRDLAMNVYLNGEWGSYRHLPLEEIPSVMVSHRIANVTTPGDLSSFSWLEGKLNAGNCDRKSKDHLVEVYYSALNFRDVMTATGKLQAEVVNNDRRSLGCVQGFEYSGRTLDGKRVMGMLDFGTLANRLVADPAVMWGIPDYWSMQDAATVPVVYGTVYYALRVRGQIRRGETILIHSGSGGIGQAAINVALHEGLTVFTTVGTQEKREFIKDQYPQIPDNHIFNSRDTSFEERVKEETSGRGVDLVLNSLAEEKLLASVRCLARGGRFLEIGKFDLANNNPLGMEFLLRECSYQSLMLDVVVKSSSKAKKIIHDLLAEGISTGAVRPLPRTVFKDDELEQAFRYMTTGKHIGKVLVQMREEEPDKLMVPVPRTLPASPRLFCNPTSSYIMIGGLGGFGLELADWLVLRGARNLVLTSRRGVTTGYQTLRRSVWRSYGVHVEVSTDDVTSQQGVETLLKTASALGPVEGIFNLAVVLQDALLANQTEEKFAISAAPKALATRLLDAASRRLCPHMRHFVVFSSVSCGRGNAGQSNYGMSNSVMERICERRRAEGLPGLAIQWGAVGEVGLVAEMQEENHEIAIGGTLQQTIASCLSVMDRFLRQPNPIVGSMVVAEKRTSGAVAGTMVDCVANIMGISNMKAVNLHATLAEIGMDSMMAVEIVQTLEREYEVFLTPQDIRAMTFAKLFEMQASDANGDAAAANKSSLGDGEGQRPTGPALLVRLVGKVGASMDPVITMSSEGPSPTVFMVPGLEGMSTVLEPMARNISGRILCLQLPVQYRFCELQELAHNLLLNMTATDSTEPFFLVGYSFGGLLAMEMAAALESRGRKGKLVLIDTAPDMIKTAITSLALGNDDVLQINIITNMLMTVCPESYFDVKETLLPQLYQLPAWQERLDHAVGSVPATDFSTDYGKKLATAIYLRAKSAANYTWAHDTLLECPVLLIRPKNVTVTMESEDFGLQKICKHVIVNYVQGDHVSMLENPQVATLVSEFFKKDSCL